MEDLTRSLKNLSNPARFQIINSAPCPIPVILFGKDFWQRVIGFDMMVYEGTISPEEKTPPPASFKRIHEGPEKREGKKRRGRPVLKQAHLTSMSTGIPIDRAVTGGREKRDGKRIRERREERDQGNRS